MNEDGNKLEFKVETHGRFVEKMKNDYAGNTEEHPERPEASYDEAYIVLKEMYEKNREKKHLRLSWF